ncbi:endoplasmic reticulum metallopeptidase 1-like isoform X2 [Actinia tenebrosa]|uniref:Endoplasmic reticulum metallopeptidase 1-like isoform X2 n=1 Tax=Actinia tenebrosa TaxID=6105 RepID=A0A6P8HCU5_ACTTE|nr:endoplasmic reticulum metallopeptidase 1-like isoform X2 [Actinia tenebrosa]
MADVRLRKGGLKSSLESSEAENKSYRNKEELTVKEKRGYSWIFVSTLCFYGVILGISYLESRSVPSPKRHVDSHIGEFSEERARVHLDAITSFGPRPTGSVANEIHTVKYILDQVANIKLSAKKSVVIEVDVQKPSGTFFLDFLDGFTSHYYNITNIVVRVSPVKNSPPEHSVLINAHFDSVPNSPGASDDAVSCATMLEILRVMAQCPAANLTHAVIFLFNGAEENVLQASHGFITQHPWTKSIRAFVNLEAAGAGGKEIVFQTGPEHPWLVKAYTEVAPYPSAQVIGQEIFQNGLIPSDTDFRIFRDHGNIPGIDIAYHTNGYVYHTYYDTPAAITPGSIQRAGENVLTVVMEMANSPLLTDPGEYRHGAMVFFDFMGLFMVHYPERIGVIINGITFIFTVALIAKKMFISRKKGEGGMQVNRISITSLLSSFGILLLSWVAGLTFPLTVAAILTTSGHSLTWFCRPYLIAGLFVSPVLLGIGSVHCLVKHVTLLPKEKSSGDKTNALTQLWQQETNVFYSSLIIWTGLLGVMTYYNLASAHLPLLWVIFPLCIRVFIWENMLRKNSCGTGNIVQFLIMYLSSVLVPVCFTSYSCVTVLDLFMPIMGRSGSQTIPDVFIAVIVAILVIVLTSYLVSLLYLMRNMNWAGLFLCALTFLSISISLSGLAFPYSAEKQCPKRFFYQHIVRTFHGMDGSVVKKDSGIWLNPLDYNGITHLKDVPLIKQAKQVMTDDGVYQGFPYYLPARNLFKT